MAAVSDRDTIAAIATPPGRGGISIVRLSGPEAIRIATPLLRLRHPLAPTVARFGELVDPETGERLDEVLATWFAAPHSYTGEDVVEIAAHGSPVLLDHLLRLALNGGARLAEPGEFTERAFLSGRMDLTQAEAVRDLIEAQTLFQARLAARQMEGTLSRRVRPVKQQLMELIAVLEAGIDFAEDDIDVAPAATVLARIAEVEVPLKALATSFRQGSLVHNGISLAIVGRPNVGKSSLFNRLVDRERAIVTATPGTTRDLIAETVSLDGIPVRLVDTAGLRAASEEAEQIGIRKSREAMADADLVLLVVEAAAELDAEERALLDGLREGTGIAPGRGSGRVIVARNKCDLDRAEPGTAEATPGVAAVRTSALTGEGIAELRAAILECARGPGLLEESGMLTSLRQHQAVEGAVAALAAALAAVAEATPHEMVLLDLYGALRQLDSLTGETTPDDVLNLIFSTFCIGK